MDNAHLFRESQRAHEQLRQLNEELEQRVAERTNELSRAELQFQELVSGVVDYAIYMLDVDGHIASWNAGAERIKGYSKSRSDRQALLDVLHAGGSREAARRSTR